MYPEQPCGQNKTTGLTKASAACVQDAQNKVLHSQDPLSFNKHMACSNATGIHQVANQCHTVHAQKLQVGPGAGQVCRRCTQSVVDVWSVRQWCKSSQEFEGLCCLLKASILRIHTQMTWCQIMVSLSFHIDKKYQELITFGNQFSCFNISVNIFHLPLPLEQLKSLSFQHSDLGALLPESALTAESHEVNCEDANCQKLQWNQTYRQPPGQGIKQLNKFTPNRSWQ